MLKFRFPGKRIRFTDAQRVALVRKDKVIGRKALMELETIVSPDALMRCHRKLIAQNWMHRNRRGTRGPEDLAIDRPPGSRQS